MQRTLDCLGIPSLPVEAFRPDAMGKIRLYGKGGGYSAPPPDPLIGQAAMRQAALGEDYMQLTRQQYEESKPRQARMDALSEGVTNQQMRIADSAEARGAENYSRYKEKFVPIENQFLQEAQQAGGLTDQQRGADQAVAGMRAQGAIERDSTNRDMMSMGVNPNSGKFNGAARANQLMATARTAGAGNMAREGSRLSGISMRASASNLGRGMMADTNAAGGLALQGGGGALSAGMAGNNYLGQRQAGLGSGTQAAMAGNAGMATGLGNLYNAQVNQAVGQNNADAQTYGSTMGAIGQGAMAYGMVAM